MNVENPDTDINGNEYQTHIVPYTKSKKEIQKWASKAIKDCVAKAATATKGFPISSETGGGYLDFINKMYSIYQGTYTHPELGFLTSETETEEEDKTKVLPARLINYPLLKNNFDKIVGSFVETSIDLSVATVSPHAIDAKTKKRAELMFNKLLGEFVKGQEEATGVKLENSMPVVDDEDRYLTLSFKQMEELNMSKLLKVCYTKHAWNVEIAKAFLQQLLLGFFAYKIVEINGDEVKILVPKPQNVIADWGCEDDFGQDATFFGIRRKGTIAGINGYLRPNKEEQAEIRELLQDRYKSASGGEEPPASAFEDHVFDFIDCTWYAEETVYVKIVKNKYTGKEIVKYLKSGEDAELSKKEKANGARIETRNRGVWYQGYLIGNCAIRVEKCTNMPVSIYNPSMAEGDFVFGQYNRVYNQPNGMMQGVAPLQILWNELLYKLELELATSPGSVVEYNHLAKPDRVPYSQIFYYMKAKKLLITKQPGSARAIDLGLSSTQHLLNIMMYIENLAEYMTGSNRFKKGDVSGETSPGVMNTAIEQSDRLLIPYFLFHREALRKVFKKAMAKLKVMNQYPGEKQKYILGETGFQYFTIEPTLPTEEYDVYFVDGTVQTKKKQMLMTLMDRMWSSGQATIEHALAVVRHDDVNEIYAELNKLVEFAKKRQDAIDQQAAAIQQAQMASDQQIEQLKAQIEQMKKEYDKEIAQIYADAGIKKEVVVEDFKRNNPEVNTQ